MHVVTHLFHSWALPLRVSSETSSSSAALPLALSVYKDESFDSLLEVLSHRVAVEPLNLFATVIFILAIVHTFCAPWLLRLAKRREERQHLSWLSTEGREAGADEPMRFRTVALHYLGELEAVFGVWMIPLLIGVSVVKGWEPTKDFIEHSANFNEAVFVVVIMAMASSQPILYVAEVLLSALASLFGGTVLAWWCVLLMIGPLLGSLVTEPAAMTISALLLAQHFFRYHPSKRLSYVTLGLLFSNVSVGGLLTTFAAPPVVMVADRWGWTTSYMFATFGLKALGAILFATFATFFLFRKELRALTQRVSSVERGRVLLEKPTPYPVVVINILFMVWTVWNAGSPRLVIGGFLFFLAFVDATRHFQRSVSLRTPLMVGFFLCGLVVHGAFQSWWIEPFLSRLGDAALLVGSAGLSAFNDNAAITYLASLVPGLPDEVRYLIVSGAVAAGGVTVLANAPNPAGNALLSRYFEGGISQILLFVATLFPLVVNLMFFVAFR